MGARGVFQTFVTDRGRHCITRYMALGEGRGARPAEGNRGARADPRQPRTVTFAQVSVRELYRGPFTTLWYRVGLTTIR